MEQKHRIGNAMVDTLAKESAADDKLPAVTLQWIAERSSVLTDIAMWIGRCTHLANNFRLGSDSKTVVRDSKGLAAARLQRYRLNKSEKRSAPELPRRPGDLSQCPRWQQLRQRILEKENFSIG